MVIFFFFPHAGALPILRTMSTLELRFDLMLSPFFHCKTAKGFRRIGLGNVNGHHKWIANGLSSQDGGIWACLCEEHFEYHCLVECRLDCLATVLCLVF